jgi:ketosteroid isomerase-like protein
LAKPRKEQQLAKSDDEAAVNAAVEALTKAMLQADGPALERLVSDQLSYGHSSGLVETKAQFVDVVANRKTVYKAITLSEPSTVMAGDNAIVRHVFSNTTETGGKTASISVGIMQVWQRQAGNWKLLARQAFRLPA